MIRSLPEETGRALKGPRKLGCEKITLGAVNEGLPSKGTGNKACGRTCPSTHPLLYVTSAKHEETEEETAR